MSTVSSTSSPLATLLGTGGLTVNGLATGLDTEKIIQGLQAIDQARITQLQDKQTKIQQQQTAFKGVEARVLALQSKLTQLARPQGSVFQVRSAVSSNNAVATVAASSSAIAGNYQLRVTALAQAQEIASQGFAGATSNITQGTLDLRVGTGPTKTITIDGNNDTLQGLATAINNANAGVSAAIVFDGSPGNAQPYRILLTAADTGAGNTIQITNNLSSDSGAAVRPLFTTTVQDAADAAVVIGSGAGALTLHSASNEIDNLFPGITVDLHAADADHPITLTVTDDVDRAAGAIKDFVASFNDLMSFIDDQVRYDSASNSAGVLLGNQQVLSLQDQARRILLEPVAGLKPQMNRLSALGITTSDQGQLVVDDAKLHDALAGNLSGVTFDDIRRLFTVAGTSSVPGVNFISGTDSTVASASPYQFVITQAARQASIQAANPLDETTDITEGNNAFTLTVDGVASNTITVPAGSYSRLALAQALQAQINADAKLGNHPVTVGLNGDSLTISSNNFGTLSTVALGGGLGLTPLGFDGTEHDQGQNVIGHYVVDGHDEAAVGTGQFLLGATGNAHTSGLLLRALLTPSQVGGGVTGDVTVTRGVASSLALTVNNLLDPLSGRLKTIDDGFTSAIDDIQKEIDRQNNLMAERRDSLVKQFVALETTVNQLQGIGNYLTAQFNQLNNLSGNRR